MQTILIDAYCAMVDQHHCSSDDIVFDPELRAEFLNRAREQLGNLHGEKEILKTLVNLRKANKLPRSRDLLPPPGK